MSQNKALDNAFQHFYKKNYQKALDGFNAIIANEETPIGVKVRIEQFQKMAETQLNGNPGDDTVGLKDVSFLMNLHRFDEADEALGSVTAADHVKLYLRAEMALMQDKEDESVDLLQQAIELDAANTGYAINSPVFAEHLNNEKFSFLRKDLTEKTEE